MLKTIRGNLITLTKQQEFDILLHGCNCFCNWGAGIAKDLKRHFPQAYAADCGTHKGSNQKLGGYSASYISEFDLTILNCYTQFNWGKGKQVDYRAIEKIMASIAANYPSLRIGLPMIGAGGNWGIISRIIEQYLPDATVVEYDNS